VVGATSSERFFSSYSYAQYEVVKEKAMYVTGIRSLGAMGTTVSLVIVWN